MKATETPVPAHAANLAAFVALAGPTTEAVLACRIGSSAALRPGVRSALAPRLVIGWAEWPAVAGVTHSTERNGEAGRPAAL